MTQLLPGQLLYVFGVSILDAALLSWLALLWYRRSVNRLMRETSVAERSSTADSQRPRISSPPVAPPIGPVELTLSEESPQAPGLRGAFQPRGMRRVIAAYSIGAAAFAAVVTALKFWTASPLPAVAWLVEWWTNLWPLVPTLAILLVLDRWKALRITLLYVLGGAIAICAFTAGGQLLRGSFNTAPLTNVFWAIVSLAWTASVPFAVILLTGWRRVRAVMPLALAGTLLFGFGSMLFREMLIRALNVEAFRSVFLGGAMVSSIETMQYALFMFVALPVGWIAWRLLNVLALAFASKGFSDIQFILDCWWAVVTAEVTATSLATTYGISGIVGGAAAFLAYRIPVAVMLRGDLSLQRAPRLLLLRVFGYQGRTEALFDRVAQTWRLQGPVQLIAGVDLAMRTADPGDILALLGGRLADSYVRTPEEIDQRLRRLDLQPDPDGRFRINEIYCHDNTWRPMLEALLGASDRVLMDLRTFSAHNAGCRFELEQLVRHLPTENLVLVCDKTTDLPLLHQILSGAWEAARKEGQARGSGTISVVRVERQSRSEFALLMQRLLPSPAQVPA
jgi:hypothetical protein